MTTKIINPTQSAYNYPLLIKNILNTPLIYSPDQEIIYRDNLRYNYSTFRPRDKWHFIVSFFGQSFLLNR